MAICQAPSGAAWREGLANSSAIHYLEGSDETLEQLRRAVERGGWERAGELLATLPQDLPQWGAEVATLRALRNEPEMRNVERIHLLTSNTEEGRSVGKTLANALTGWERLRVTMQVNTHLDPASSARYKVEGLRNLFACLADVTREVRSHSPVFVVSGGFKAQVAFTTVVAQALGVPVA